MKRFPVALATLCLLLVTSAAAQEENACLECHLEQDPPYSTPAEHFEIDVHFQAGFGCESCHGGDPTSWDFDEAKDEAAGFTGIPEGEQIVATCARCHSDPAMIKRFDPNLATDQEAQYWTSGHGVALKDGNMAVAQCSSCHNTHQIRKVSDPKSAVFAANVVATCGSCHGDAELMGQFDLSHNIINEYSESVHGLALLGRGDTGAPGCNTCHGNHGAAPPDAESVQAVCGVCHVNNMALFRETKMMTKFSARGEDDLHGCAVCHTTHDIQPPTDELVALGEGSLCGKCHEADEPAAIQVALIRTTLDSLSAAITEATEMLQAAEHQGLDVENLLLDMVSGQTALIQSRTAIHTFDGSRVRQEAQAGFTLAASTIAASRELVKDFQWRKIGLGLATLMFSFFAGVLYLYIRTLEE